MNGSEMSLAIVAIILVLIINGRALAAQRLPRKRMISMGLIWIGIIVVVAAAARFFTG
ncbi:MAG: hypothetical protein ACKOQ3_12235 [Novosphingobium sp.]